MLTLKRSNFELFRCRKSFHNLVLYSLAVYFVVAHPLSCKEDEHCSEEYYCDTETRNCHPCLQCQDMNRMILESHVSNSCITFCGPCIEGFISFVHNDAKGKCVSPEVLQYENKSYYVYIWITAITIGFFITLIFIYILSNTSVFHIALYVGHNLLKPQNGQIRMTAMCCADEKIKMIQEF